MAKSRKLAKGGIRLKHEKQFFKKRPVIVEAYQWFKNGDHPEDEVLPTVGPRGKLWYTEGKVVGFYRAIGTGLEKCQQCQHILNHHGVLNTLEGQMTVCPGSWVITGIEGEKWAVKDSIFADTYDVYE